MTGLNMGIRLHFFYLSGAQGWQNTKYRRISKEKKKLTGAGDNGNVAQQAEDLWAEEGTVPNGEEFVEKSLWTGKPLLVKKYNNPVN